MRSKVIRIITRLNIGGPSIHVSLLTRGLNSEQFESILISGMVSDLEGDMGYIPDRLGIKPIFVPFLKREIHLYRDIRALIVLLKIFRRERPDIVHTHTAKAGTLGRLAAFIYNLKSKKRALVIHTFHGHVLKGYFSSLKSMLFLWAERGLAWLSDAIIVISRSQMRELAQAYRIAPKKKFRIVNLGFNLEAFSKTDELRGEFKRKLGVPDRTLLVGIVGRLVSIKDHEMFLRSAGVFIKEHVHIPIKFVVIGDGELRDELKTKAAKLNLSDDVIFSGWERNLPRVYADLNVLALTSINEGTPVSIIEAMASSVPVIATDAGGVRDLLGPVTDHTWGNEFNICRHGLLCRQNDAKGLAEGIFYLLSEKRRRSDITMTAKAFVEQNYTEERLLDDIESVYTQLLKERRGHPVIDRKEISVPMRRDKKLKVLQVYKDYYPPVIGGVEGHINLISTGLKNRGVDVEVLVSNTRPRLDIEEIDGIRVTKAPQLGRFASAPLNVSFFSWVRKLGEDADIVHFHFPNPTGEISSLFSKLNGKVVVTYHSDIVRQAKMAKLYAPLMRLFLSKMDKIIATSPNYVRSSEVLREFQYKCRVLPFGVDLKKFEWRSDMAAEVAAIRHAYGPDIILFVGRFRYYKGLYVLLEAMKSARGSLLLIGSGPMERELKHHVAADEELKQRIHFLGELSDRALIAHLHACDLFVLPSILRSEAFGIVLLEAMACGKPLISTELGTGTSFVNQHKKTGLVVPPNNAAALADAVNRLLENTELRETYGEAAKQRAGDCFSMEKMVEDLMHIYQEVRD